MERIGEKAVPVYNDKTLPSKKRPRLPSSSSPEEKEIQVRKPKPKSRGTQTTAPDTVTLSQVVAAPTKPKQQLAAPLLGISQQGEIESSSQVVWVKQTSRKARRQKRRMEAVPDKVNKVGILATGAAQAGPVPVPAPRKPKRKKPRTEAILIKPSGGRSYADVLGAIKAKARPEQSETVVRSIRQTQNGDVLLELQKSKDKAAFAAELMTALKDKGTVRSLDPRSSVEIRDLDGLSTEGDVIKALRKAIPELEKETSHLKVWLTKPNRSQQRLAVAEMADAHANMLLRLQHLRVGWISCRVRRRVEVPRCFKCLGFGHSSRNCKGPDRSKNCLRCGGGGHTRKDCEVECCFLCKENGLADKSLSHVPGSGQCCVFKTALHKAKAIYRK